MAAILCAFCSVMSNMSPVWATSKTTGQRSGADYIYRADIAVRCNNCGSLNIAIATGTQCRIDAQRLSASAKEVLESGTSSVKWFPPTVASPTFPDVPDHVARCAIEAFDAVGIGADMAAILMARTTIEAVAKDKDISSGNLVDKIDQLKEKGLVRPAVAAAAHAIRHLGNDMAHGDVEDVPTKEDASDVLALMKIVLDDVYQAAALTEGILARRSTARGESKTS